MQTNLLTLYIRRERERGGGRVVATPLSDFPVTIFKIFAVKKDGGGEVGVGVLRKKNHPEGEGVAAKINKFL